MKTTVNNIASENVTSFVINKDMLNEKKAMKYISKPNMVAAINDICAAIKGLNSLFSPQEYTEANSKKELFDAYGRFYIIYMGLKDVEAEARHRAEEKAEREAAKAKREQASKEDTTNAPMSEKLAKAENKTAKALKEASKEDKKPKADKAPKAEKTASTEGEKKSTRIGDAQARLDAYTAELAEKEAIENPDKEVKHRIASLKRKIERANAALGTK